MAVECLDVVAGVVVEIARIQMPVVGVFAVRSMVAMRVARTFHKLLDVLKGELRGFLATPIGQRRADRFFPFEAGDVVAAEAAVFADRTTRDILLQCLLAIAEVLLEQQFFVGLELGLQVIRDAFSNKLLGSNLGDRVVGEPFDSQISERLLILGRPLVLVRGHVGRLPVDGSTEQEHRNVGRGVGDLSSRLADRVLLDDWIEVQVGHLGAGVIAVRLF